MITVTTAVAISSTANHIHKEIGGNFYLSIWPSINKPA